MEEFTLDRTDLKMNAKAQLKGNYGVLFLITLVVGLVGGLAGVVPVLNIIVMSAFAIALNRIYLGMLIGRKPAVGDAFASFGDFWPSFKVQFRVAFFTALWSMLFVIPGFVKKYAYSMAPYIMAENPTLTAKECIRRSMEMTDGHKMDLFVLDLSFIGWFMLGSLSMGIGYIWIVPYYKQTWVNAYISLKSGVRY